MISSRKVTLMSGVSGSGKSREAAARAGIAMRQIKTDTFEPTLGAPMLCLGPSHASVVRLSADHYFMEKMGDSEELTYMFSPRHLGLAHGVCLRQFIKACDRMAHHIIVDNTATDTIELAPYVAVALSYDYEVEIVTLMCSNLSEVERCHGRNQHKVPLQSVLSQHERLGRRIPPPHWNASTGVRFTQLSVVFGDNQMSSNSEVSF